MRVKKSTQSILTECANMVALSLVIEVLLLFLWNKGALGTQLTVCGMLPLVILSYRRGWKWAVGASAVLSVFEILLDIEVFRAQQPFIGIWRIILLILFGYIVAYSLIGFAGIFRGKMAREKAICLGTLAAGGARTLVLILCDLFLLGAPGSGNPEWYFEQLGWSARVAGLSQGQLRISFALHHTLSYMVPELLITTLAAYAISKLPGILRRVTK